MLRRAAESHGVNLRTLPSTPPIPLLIMALTAYARIPPHAPPVEGSDMAATIRVLLKADPRSLTGTYSMGRGTQEGYLDSAVCLGSDGWPLPGVRVLLQEGVHTDVRHTDPDDWRNTGGTALHSAAKEGLSDCVRALLEAGADPNARTDVGLTPLHLAAQSGVRNFDGCMRLLVAAGADVNARDSGGWAPIDTLGSSDSPACTRVWRVLTQLGADPAPAPLPCSSMSQDTCLQGA
jgi:hypothetical protein